MEDLEELEELSKDIKEASLCGLGQTAPNPVLSTLRFFRDEYIAHVRDKQCPAGVCRELTDFVVDKEKCIACGICAKACSVDAVIGEKKKTYYIDRQKCVKCGACQSRCPKDAIFKIAMGGEMKDDNKPADGRTTYPTRERPIGKPPLEKTGDLVNIFINDEPVKVDKGTNVLEACRENGYEIPSLCYLKDLNTAGSCRVCVVEIEGSRNLQAACVYPVTEG
ncbi:hypothetical protein N752_23140 [Desulforamulus aquiferis]|nr:hypothetical protein N752_23140 [Desulforamulus aquiferis]